MTDKQLIKLDRSQELKGVQIIPIDKHFIDDRGRFTNLSLSEHLSGFKRCYLITNHKSGVVRAFHGHMLESKLFYVIRGTFKFIVMEMESKNNEKKQWKEYVLSSDKQEMLLVPNNYYNGFVSLTDKNVLMCFSTSTIKESVSDDYRLPYDYLGDDVWSIKNR